MKPPHGSSHNEHMWPSVEDGNALDRAMEGLCSEELHALLIWVSRQWHHTTCTRQNVLLSSNHLPTRTPLQSMKRLMQDAWLFKKL
eukprot:12918624-Prorocentrum_lima.AAC.1